VEKFFARNLGGLTRARTGAGPAREGRSRTPSMYAGEKSDEAIVPRKRSNKGRQLPAEVVEGRASPKGNSRQAAVVRTQSRIATSIRLAAMRRRAAATNRRAADVRPETAAFWGTPRGAVTGDFVQGAASLANPSDCYREERLSLAIAIRWEAARIE
jgi:hypothetical protein